jgi:hypothetical protein
VKRKFCSFEVAHITVISSHARRFFPAAQAAAAYSRGLTPYERAGTANIFMFTEPLAGWREAMAREFKTKVDWAREMA